MPARRGGTRDKPEKSPQPFGVDQENVKNQVNLPRRPHQTVPLSGERAEGNLSLQVLGVVSINGVVGKNG